MRILNISYKNINSLEGEGELSFEHGPIAESGVFAITGPNGSGKTSILDVITLALYGETFRFAKPAEHIITKNTDESYAQIEFSYAGKKYRSRWEVKRANITLIQMYLFNLDDNLQLLAETPIQVRNYLAELIGMDFHRFSKTIVLPQGDFAAFLNALDSERLDILEKIGGTDLYIEYKKQLESQYNSLNQKLSAVKDEVGMYPLLSAAELDAANQDLADFQEQDNDLKYLQKQLQQRLADRQNLNRLEEQQKQFTEEQQKIALHIETQQQELNKIENAPAISGFKDDLLLLDTMQTSVKQTRQHLQEYLTDLKQLEAQFATIPATISDTQLNSSRSLPEQKQIIDDLKLKLNEIKLKLPRQTELSTTIQQLLQEKQSTLTEVESWLQNHQADAELIDHFPDLAGLRKIRTELQELAVQQKSQGKWSKKAGNDLKNAKTALTDTENRIQELNNQIESNEKKLQSILQGKSSADWQAVLVDQQNRVADFQELYTAAKLNARFSLKKSWLDWLGFKRQEIVEELPDVSSLQTRLDSLKQEMIKEENISKALEQAINNEGQLKRLMDLRNKLVDGKPCGLCGSLTHPYVIKPPIYTDSKRALADQRARSLILKNNIKEAEQQLAAAQKRVSQLTAKQKFLQEQRAAWITMANRLNIVQTGLEISNLELQEKLLAQENAELNKIKSIVQEQADLQSNTVNAKAEMQEHQAKIGKLRLTSEQLEANWNARYPEISEFEQKVAQLVADEKQLSIQIEQQLQLLAEKLPKKGKENSLIDKLNARRQDYQIRQLRQTGLNEEIADLLKKSQASQAVIPQYNQQFQELQIALANEECLGLHINIKNKQLLIANQQQELNSQEIALEQLLQTLKTKINKLGYVDIEQLKNIVNLVEHKQEIIQLQEQNKIKLNNISEKISQIHHQWEVEKNNLIDVPDLVELQHSLKLIAEKLEIGQQEIKTLNNKLDKQQQYQTKYENMSHLLNEYQSQLAVISLELEQFNTDSVTMRQKMRQILIDKLIDQTNKILEKISGRYYLRSATSEHGLALEIEDSKQLNVRRQPKSLSGGESFVLSLALALGLAEIANSGKAIESLFLDEGFGNLDPEALYLAMNALEGLKIQGKTVGVISHVEGVKKRIKTQVEMTKKPNGFSELKMVA